MHIRRISTVKKIVSAIMEVAARRFGGQVLIWVICTQGAPLLWPSLQARKGLAAAITDFLGIHPDSSAGVLDGQ
jgi:hypothetical protein